MMERDSRLDIVKGLAILLMVLGHCCLPKQMTTFIYSFHMPVFFLLSGVVFNMKHAEDGRAVATFGGKRLMRIWLPFVIWSILFILAHNTLLSWHVYDSSVESAWTIPTVLQKIANSLIFLYPDVQLDGTFWFLKLVFYSSCGYCLVSYLLRKLHINVILGQTILILGAFIAGRFVTIYIIRYFGGGDPLLPYALFHIGYMLKQGGVISPKMSVTKDLALFVLSFVIILFCPTGTNYWYHGTRLVLMAVVGYYMLMALADILSRTKVCNLMSYIGRHTMPIVLLHFAAFKLISAVLIFCAGDPIWKLAAFPIAYVNWPVRLIYLIFGTALPLLAAWLYYRGLDCVKRRWAWSRS